MGTRAGDQNALEVGVAAVDFDGLFSMVVPQPDRRVEGAGEHELAVWRKLDKGAVVRQVSIKK
jgi:hypothetical protein